ncbi:hypothetical protein P8452_00993 [Trifolium repens]|nr:hypothetical protein P8452_00993 [Trifolium repens]
MQLQMTPKDLDHLIRKKVCQKKKKKKGWSEVIEIEKTEKCRKKERENNGVGVGGGGDGRRPSLPVERL